MAQQARTFRVFVSSTFKDMMVERNVLQELVFPRLRLICEAYGTRFQVVDLRWGVSVQAQRDQQTMPLCIDEIKRCRDISPRPHFIFLLGERYGWVPLPSTITASEFERLTAVMKADKTLVEQWYSRDNNAIPPIYRLRPRSVDDSFPGDPDWAEAEALEAAEWTKTETKLHAALLKAASEAGLTGHALTKYSMAATEQEIEAALFGPEAPDDASEHIFGFIRRSNIRDDSAIVSLKNRLHQKLPAEHLVMYDPIENDAKRQTEFVEAVFEALKGVIESELQILSEEDPLNAEKRAHFEFGNDRRGGFIGREKELGVVDNYLKKGKAVPIIVHGESGSGKSAFMAEALHRVLHNQNNPVIVVRFIGATPSSTVGRLLLRSLCAEIDQAYDIGPVDLPETYPELQKAFRERLRLSTETRPLYIFLDALDQFARDDPAQDLGWLQSDLPKNTRIILSTVPGPVLDRLTSRITGEHLLIGDFRVNDADRLLDAWLRESNRTLQSHQKNIILAGFRSCPRPLYLKLAAEEAKKWQSVDRPAALPNDLYGMISVLFDRLASESEHGAVLVEHSLGYLVSARNGLAEDELLDILSLDEAVTTDQRRRTPLSPRVDRLPPVVWSRLRADLNPYLIERAADGTSLIGFYHHALTETVRSRYPGIEKGGWNSVLADYFASKATSRNGVPQLRKLSELPHQLMSAQRTEDLEVTLTDYEFLYYKNRESGPQSVVDDCTNADRMGCGTSGIDAIEEAMRLSSNVVSKHPEQLPGQLTGRLSGQTNGAIKSLLKSIPRIHEGPWLRPVITPMAQPEGPLLRTLETGQGRVNDIAVSKDGMTVVTAGDDGSIAIWDVVAGREMHRMEGHEHEARHIALSPQGRNAISISFGEVCVWEVISGRRLHTIDMGRGWPGPAAVLDERWALVGSVDSTISLIDMEEGRVVRQLKGHDKKVVSIDAWGDFAVSAEERRMIVWNAGNLRRGSTSRFARSVIHKIGAYEDKYAGNRMVIAVGAKGKNVLTGRGAEDSPTILWDLKSGHMLRKIPNTRELWVSRIAAAREQDRYVMGVLEQGVGRSNTYSSGRLFLVDDGQIMSSIEVGTLSSLAVSADGMTAVIGGTNVTVWDLDALNSTGGSEGIPALSAIDISDVSGTVVGADDSGRLLKIDPASGSTEWIGEPAGRVIDIAVSDDERNIVAVLEEGSVEIWEEDRKKQTITVPGVNIKNVDITPDGSEFAGAGQESRSLFGDESRWRWEVSTGRVINHEITPSRCLVIARGTGQVACIGGFGVSIDDGTGLRAVRLRNLPEGPAYAWVQALAVDNFGERIAASMMDNTVQVWDTIKKEQVAELILSKISRDGSLSASGGVVSLWLSPDGRWCLAASSDLTVNLWEVGVDVPAAVYTTDKPPKWVGATEDGSIIVVMDEFGGLYTFKIEGVSMDLEVRM
jgi:WD40 repeat protein